MKKLFPERILKISRVSAAMCALIGALLPVTASAATGTPVGAGCHAATAAEQTEMVARGLPKAYEVCPKDTQILGIGQDFEQWYAKLRTIRPCNVSNKCTLSCRTRNTGAQVCGPTARRWNSIGCHPNNNTAIFPTVSHGFAAHIELLRRYCGERKRCTINAVISTWAGGNHAEYANFVSRAAGIPSNKVFDPNDIDMIGRLALSMSCFEAGSMPYNVTELKQGLTMAGGGARVPTPSNVGQLLNESMQGSYASNPSYSPSSAPSSWTYPPSAISSNGTYTPPSYSSPATTNTSSATPFTNPLSTNPFATSLANSGQSLVSVSQSSQSTATSSTATSTASTTPTTRNTPQSHPPKATSAGTTAGGAATGQSVDLTFDSNSRQSLSPDSSGSVNDTGVSNDTSNLSGPTTFQGNAPSSHQIGNGSTPTNAAATIQNILATILAKLRSILATLAARLLGR